MLNLSSRHSYLQICRTPQPFEVSYPSFPHPEFQNSCLLSRKRTKISKMNRYSFDISRGIFPLISRSLPDNHFVSGMHQATGTLLSEFSRRHLVPVMAIYVVCSTEDLQPLESITRYHFAFTSISTWRTYIVEILSPSQLY